MILWQLLCVIGIVFLLLEMFTPSMFFLNFALASFITAVISAVYNDIFGLVIIFFILSFLSFAFLRPVLLRRNTKGTGIEEKYIGKVAKVKEDITSDSGVITIYGERWEARSVDCSQIPKGCNVEIVKNESLIMYVKKEGEEL